MFLHAEIYWFNQFKWTWSLDLSLFCRARYCESLWEFFVEHDIANPCGNFKLPICYLPPQMILSVMLCTECRNKCQKSPNHPTCSPDVYISHPPEHGNFCELKICLPQITPPPRMYWDRVPPDLVSTHTVQTLFSDPNLITVKNLNFTAEWWGVVSAFETSPLKIAFACKRL